MKSIQMEVEKLKTDPKHRLVDINRLLPNVTDETERRRLIAEAQEIRTEMQEGTSAREFLRHEYRR